MAQFVPEFDFFDDGSIEDVSGPFPQRMIVIKVLHNGDVHAEDSRGQMIIVRANGKVKSFLDYDVDWVKGKIDDNASAWDVIGFFMGMTNGQTFEKARRKTTH